MAAAKRIRGIPVKITGRGVGRLAPAIPVGLPRVLRRFWKFARDMARRFSKNLMKTREEEFLKVVKKHFEKGI